MCIATRFATCGGLPQPVTGDVSIIADEGDVLARGATVVAGENAVFQAKGNVDLGVAMTTDRYKIRGVTLTPSTIGTLKTVGSSQTPHVSQVSGKNIVLTGNNLLLQSPILAADKELHLFAANSVLVSSAQPVVVSHSSGFGKRRMWSRRRDSRRCIAR